LNPYIQTEAREVGKDKILKIIPLVRDRMKKLSEWPELTKYFFTQPEARKIAEIYSVLNLKVDIKTLLAKILEFLKNTDNWQSSDVWQTGLRKIADELKIKHSDIFMILRVCIWGDRITPPLYETMMVLGKEESLERIEKVI
jgi:glutamyl-tRNA synthetase